MYSTNQFSRDLAIATYREYRDPNVRRTKVKSLYDRFGVSEVVFDGRIVGWNLGSNQFICFKKRYATEADARLVTSVGMVKSRGKHAATNVYHCKNCDGWHATSKGHMAGKYK